MLKEKPINLDERIVKLCFLVVQSSPYDVIVSDPTMKSMEGVLDLEHRVSSFLIDGDKVEIPIEHD